ncbi:MAG: hypothetical protein D4R94_05170 [Chitinophagaceae bacterium]|nr:MAG: hypothetical protein D4R94_05170 [Chitinophagaceae bacterium]
MKKYILYLLVACTVSLVACNKTEETKDLWAAVIVPASPISESTPLTGPVKGTMLAGKTYTVVGDIFVNTGDTLIIQPGVTVNFTGTAGVPVGVGVKGTLLSLGTKENPIMLTYSGVTKTDQLGSNPDLDPALKGKWTGIIGATTCPLIVIKWTHIEFGGAAISSAMKSFTGSSSPYSVYFANPDGSFILEDSWIYGSVDDPFRINGGKIHVMRNTFEKCGYTGGEAMNSKAGTIGDFAYNLCIGIATNGPKVSNINVAVGKPGSNVRIFNNTMINCGYRRSAAGRGGSINFEEGAGGMAYNNLIVNCKFGLRVVGTPIADTANLKYGYNFYYADSISVASQFIPSLSVSTAISKPMETDIPKPSTYLPSGWAIGAVYTAPASVVGANNPLFINAPVPLPAGLMLRDIAVVGNYNFALKPNSPCIGAGFIGFSPRADVIQDLRLGATEITPPGKDIGCYQSNGRGNQH